VGQFEDLYQALQIPREDINAAWYVFGMKLELSLAFQ
jgi:hypothetical protein